MKQRLRRYGPPLLIVMVIAVVAVLYIQHWLDASNTGTVHVGTPPVTAQLAPEPIDIKTAYFTTTLPAGFSEKRRTETPNGTITLLQLVAATSGTTDEQFAATVAVLPSGGLTEVGDYNLRVKDPADYVSFTPESLPSGAVAYRNNSGPTAFTVFWPHGSRYVEVALSTQGGATLEQLQTVFIQVMSAWQWQ